MKTKEPIITDEKFLDIITDEITNTIIDCNLNLVYLLNLEQYEEAAEIRDMITLFLLDAATIISSQSKIRKQTAYMHFNKQNDYVRTRIMSKHLKKF